VAQPFESDAKSSFARNRHDRFENAWFERTQRRARRNKMTDKDNTIADVRVQIMELERHLEQLAQNSAPKRALRLRQASDLLTEARACELFRLL
jgi:hypothetical protein